MNTYHIQYMWSDFQSFHFIIFHLSSPYIWQWMSGWFLFFAAGLAQSAPGWKVQWDAEKNQGSRIANNEGKAKNMPKINVRGSFHGVSESCFWKVSRSEWFWWKNQIQIRLEWSWIWWFGIPWFCKCFAHKHCLHVIPFAIRRSPFHGVRSKT